MNRYDFRCLALQLIFSLALAGQPARLLAEPEAPAALPGTLPGTLHNDYKQLGSLPLKSGSLKFLESSNGTALVVRMEAKPIPVCTSEVIPSPNRILISCTSEILAATSPLTLAGSKIASKARFSKAKGSSRIALDIIGDVPQVSSPSSSDGSLSFVLRRAGKQLEEPLSPSAVSTVAIPAAISETATSTATAVPPTPTSVPTPIHEAQGALATPRDASSTAAAAPVVKSGSDFRALNGETFLSSVSFTRSGEAGKPTIKVNLRAERKVKLEQDSQTKYRLKITSARILSAIFSTPQVAPEGFEPFASVVVQEQITPDNPVDLEVQIELSSPATLTLRQKGGELEIFPDK